jgi:peptidyl-prolyl cis-trans isomerase A (cyclophilin A)
MRRALIIVSALAVPVLAIAQGSGVDLSKAKLRTPTALTEKAPDTYKAKLDTSKGVIVIDVHRDWAPIGADRFYNLVKNGFYDDTRFFRVLDGFMAQIGINGNPAIQSNWRNATITDDPVKQSNKRGFVTYAKSGAPNSRSTQIFINYRDNSSLDRQGFAPFGEVTTGMDIVDKLYSGYGEGAPGGSGPEQGKIQMEGNAYLTKSFPKLDYIKKATVEK